MIKPKSSYTALPTVEAALLLDGAVEVHLRDHRHALIAGGPWERSLWLPVERGVLEQIGKDYREKGWHAAWEANVLRIAFPDRIEPGHAPPSLPAPLPTPGAASLLGGAVDAHLEKYSQVLIAMEPAVRPNALWLPVGRDVLLHVEKDYAANGWLATWEGDVLRIAAPGRLS